jgi:DNA-binding transcriptional regulator of glucitol operon
MKTKLPNAFWRVIYSFSSSTLKTGLWGALLVLVASQITQAQWTQVGSSIPGDVAGAFAGSSVALSSDGQTMAIGAPGTNGARGQVKIYKVVSGAWTLQGNAISGDAVGNQVGASVALSSDGLTVAVGAPGVNFARGQVRVYKLISGTWTQQDGAINGDAAANQAGASVALSSDGLTVAVGAPGTTALAPGQVKIYKLTSGAWTQQGNALNGDAGNRVGTSVDLSSDGLTVAVGAPGVNFARGQVRVYKLISGTWTQQDGAINGDAAANQAGASVALSSDGLTVAVGAPGTTALAPGQVKIYKLTSGAWTQQGNALNGDAGNRVGTSVDLSSDGLTVAVGAPGVNTLRGQVKVYKLASGAWTQQGNALSGDADGDLAGSSVALSANGKIVALGSTQLNLNFLTGLVKAYQFCDLIASINPLSISICTGTSTNLVASGGDSYAWSDNQSGASITVSPTINTVYTVTATSGVCSATASATVYVKPLPDAGFSGLASSYCANDVAVTLTATTPGGTFSGPGVSGTLFTPANAGLGGTVSYSVTVDGCSNTSSQTVTVKPLPDAGFTGLASSYCANDAAVTLTATTPGGTFSGPGIAGNIFTPVNAGVGGTVSYSVTVNGCTNTSSQNVIVKPLPIATLTFTGSITDNTPTVTLMAGGGTTYAFSAGANQQGGQSGNTATVNAPGPYSVTVTQNGCTASASTTVTGATSQSSCRNGSGVINVVVSGTPVKYEWYRNSINSARLTENPAQVRGTSTASLSLVNQQVTANYYVRVTDANGSAIVYGPFKFTVNLGCNIYARVGTEEVELKISLLGNPLTDNQLRANVVGAAGKALTVQLIDLSGRPIRTQQWSQANSEQEIDWNLTGQASGVYLLQAATETTDSVPAQRHQLKVIKP